MSEIEGKGSNGTVSDIIVLVDKKALMSSNNIVVLKETATIVESLVLSAM
ncbi:MAG TPA: hypothetical protein PKD13_07680 [Mariniflexile sp.]|jgi:Zn2+/Cd2+-exporting ATPase|nr:hypothetical protein [Mariniflexile sp.]